MTNKHTISHNKKNGKDEWRRETPLWLINYYMELKTFKKYNFCDCSNINEIVFTSTIHKEKGLTFANAIVYNVVDIVYPYNKSDSLELKHEAPCKQNVFIQFQKQFCFITSKRKRCYAKLEMVRLWLGICPILCDIQYRSCQINRQPFSSQI